MKKIGLFLFVASLFVATSMQAQTSVYVCSTNGAYGFCYGNSNVANCAYNKCIEYGGQTPYCILTVSSKGYGAIAIGKNSNGGQVVGAAAGYSSSSDAQARAIQECENQGGQDVTIDNTFQDN